MIYKLKNKGKSNKRPKTAFQNIYFPKRYKKLIKNHQPFKFNFKGDDNEASDERNLS